MSIWDSMKKFAQPYADDDYDDYDEEDDYLDDYEEPAQPAPSRRSAPAAARTPRRAPAPEPVEEDEEDDELEEDTGFSFGIAPAASTAPATDFGGRVLNMNASKQEVVLFRPGSFNDTSKAADDLRNRRAVIVNMEGVNKDMARRVVDFLSGCVYALDGDVKKIAQFAYLFCPHNMDIVGDLEAIQAEVESLT